MRVLIKKRTRFGHQEKNKTRQWKVSEVLYKTFKTFLLFINLINRTIDIDVILHKAGDNYVNMHGDANKFTHDCIEVRINKVI